MKIAFTGSNILAGDVNQGIEFIPWNEPVEVDAIFINQEIPENIPGNAVVFINSVSSSLQELGKPGWIRFNGWNGFINKNIWEVAGEITPAAEIVLKELGKSFLKVSDEPGFISARIISMIINEAYFSIEENVSSENEIDTAMKLGTNYPKGPFEWAAEIGHSNISELLIKLSQADLKYKPAPALLKKSNK